MAQSLRFKRSPIVVIRTFIAIEALGFVCYLLAAGLGNYKYEFYLHTFLAGILSYQTAKFLVLSGVQLVITIYAFLRWYYEEYSLNTEVATHAWGVFFKKKQTVMLKKTMSVTLSAGPLGKRLHYGSIHLQNSAPGSEFVMADISYPDRYNRLLARLIHGTENSAGTRPDLAKILAQEEHEKLEFKSSLRFDHRNQQASRDLEKSAMKTIAAFLNSKGGQLVIGVDNAKATLGLAADYQTLPRPNSDGFENHFTQVFNKMIGPEFRHLVHLWFMPAADAEVCVVDATPSPRPVYLKQDDNEQFFVRTGNGTTALKLSEVAAYTATRWPRRNA